MKKESKIFKAFRYLCLSFVVVIGLVSIIGTGGGGGGGGGGATSLATGEFIKTAQLDSNASWFGHFNAGVTDRRVQHLYLADEIDGSGYITAIAFRSSTNTAAQITCPDLTLKMVHTSLSALTVNFAFNVEQGKGSLETVLTNAQVVVPVVTSGDYFEIQLDTPFYYNGVDNLVVDFIRTGVCDDSIRLGGDAAFLNGALWSDNLAAATGTLDFGLNMEFTFEGGDNTLFSNPTSSAVVPFNNIPTFQREQQLYLASDINGSGPITGLGIQVANLTLEETYTVSVNLGHATVTTLASDYAANYSGSPVTVANAVSFTIPANVPANSYVWIPLPDAVFTYNGTDNLILEFNVTAATGNTRYTNHDHGSGDVRLIFGPSDASSINAVNTAIHHIKFRFNGGTMDVIPSEPPGISSQVFGSINSQIMGTYASTELGSKGTITRVAVRLVSDSIADEYPDYRLVMGHANTLGLNTGQTYLDQMENDTTTYTGTISIPTGLEAGDWVEIPLSTPFTYDPEKNLVVYFDNTASTGSNTNPIRTSTAAQFLDRGAGNNSENSSQNTIPDWTDDHVMHIRLWLQ